MYDNYELKWLTAAGNGVDKEDTLDDQLSEDDDVTNSYLQSS